MKFRLIQLSKICYSDPAISVPVFISAFDVEQVSLSFAEPELASIALRLEVEELDGVQEVSLPLCRLLLNVFVSQVESIYSRLKSCC